MLRKVKISAQEKELGPFLTNTFSLPEPTIKKDRNRFDKRKQRLGKLDQIMKDLLPLVQYFSEINSNEAGVFIEYLSWVKLQLNLFNHNPDNFDLSRKSMIETLENFDSRITKVVEYLSDISDAIASENLPISSKYSICSSQQSSTESTFYTFIKRGQKAYPVFIDIYELWLTPEELKAALFTRADEFLSFSVMSILAVFTLPRDNPENKALYSKMMKGARVTLHRCYDNPSYNGVKGLALLCFIYLARLNTAKALKYFTSAISLFSFLENNSNLTNPKRIQDPLKSQELFEKRKKIYKALVLASTVFHTMNPELPPFDLKPSSGFHIESSEDIMAEIKSKARSESSDSSLASGKPRQKFKYENILMELFSLCNSHIQEVRKQFHPFNKPELIPPKCLRLPPAQLKRTLDTIFSIQDKILGEGELKIKPDIPEDFEIMDYVLIKFKDANAYITHYKSLLKMFLYNLFIILYYPSILVYPQPVEMTNYETMVLFASADVSTQVYVNLINEQKKSLCNETKEGKNSEMVQASNSEDVKINANSKIASISKSNLLIILSLLKDIIGVLKGPDKKEAVDSCTRIKTYIHNFSLPEDFKMESFKTLGLI